MKRFTHCLTAFACLVMAMVAVSCDKESDTPPGLSIESGAIASFPGESVVVKATVSDEVGIQSIHLTCPEMGVDKLYDLSSQKPVVFNVSYQFVIPLDTDTDIPANFRIEVLGTSGKTTVKPIQVTYLPDTTDPVITTFGDEIGVDFDDDNSIAEPTLVFSFTDDRGLASARLQIADISFDETLPLSGRSDNATFYPVFDASGLYDATLTVTDDAGNTTAKQIVFGVIGEEPENPISDYTHMWIVNTEEDPADYMLGYYQYMARTDAYIYSVLFYAPKADTKIAFVPIQDIDGADYFGRSPYASTKILNNKGYVLPITIPAVGYYNVSINIQTHALTITPHTPAAVNPFAGQVRGYSYVNGGSTNSQFATSPVNGNPMRLASNFDIVDPAGSWPNVVFITSDWSKSWNPVYDSTWTYIIRWEYNAAFVSSYAYFESVAAGIHPAVFDMEAMWVTMKKPQP